MTTGGQSGDLSIGAVIRNAVAFNPQNWQGTGVDADALPAAVQRLLAMLRDRQVAYMLVGGIAVLSYVSGRNTEDVDLIISPEDLRRLPEIVISEQNRDFAQGRFDGLQIDLLLTCNRLFERVWRRHGATRQFAEQAIVCATVEGLLLLKLYALPSLYRQGDFARVAVYETDVATLIEAYQSPVAPLLAELTDHLSATDLATLRDILAEIEQRIARFERGGGGSGRATDPLHGAGAGTPDAEG